MRHLTEPAPYTGRWWFLSPVEAHSVSNGTYHLITACHPVSLESFISVYSIRPRQLQFIENDNRMYLILAPNFLTTSITRQEYFRHLHGEEDWVRSVSPIANFRTNLLVHLCFSIFTIASFLMFSDPVASAQVHWRNAQPEMLILKKCCLSVRGTKGGGGCRIQLAC